MAQKRIEYHGSLFDISYEILNPSATEDIAILHGWGSNKELMKGAFQTCFTHYRHLYIDLPGFGASSNEMVLQTEDYAQIIANFLAELKFSNHMILGHSFGGKVATLLQPELLILVASSGIVLPKPLRVRAKIALFKLIKSIGLTSWRSYFVAEDAAQLSPPMYETFKHVVNEDFTEHFRAFRGTALLCFAEDDTATPLSTAYEIASLMEHARVVAFEGDHYFFMKEYRRIHTEVERSLEMMES